jgi:hypothetical protein
VFRTRIFRKTIPHSAVLEPQDRIVILFNEAVVGIRAHKLAMMNGVYCNYKTEMYSKYPENKPTNNEAKTTISTRPMNLPR